MYYKVPGPVLILLLFCSPALGKFGPPNASIRQKEDEIIINIYHPLAVDGNEPEAIYDEENSCSIFVYNVYVRINGSEVCVCISCFSKWKFFCC